MQFGGPHGADRHAAQLLSAVDAKMIPSISGDLPVKRRDPGKTIAKRSIFVIK